MQIDPQTLDSTAVYKLLISSVVPRPIAWVSSLDTAGVGNLAPFSYFMAITAEPPTIAFACSPREGAKRARAPRRTLYATSRQRASSSSTSWTTSAPSR